MRLLNKLLPTERRMQLAVFLVSLFVLYTISTQRLSVADLPNFYLLFFAIFIFNQQAKLKINFDWCISLVLITCVAVAASSLSDHQTVAFGRLVLYRDLFLFSFSIYLLLQADLVKFSNAILSAIVFALLLNAPLTLAEYFNFSSTVDVNESRYISPKLSYYSHIRHFSYQAFIASCCAVILYLNIPRFRYLLALTVFLCGTILIASTGRAAILAFLVFLVLCSLKLYDLRIAIKTGAICLVAIIAFLLILSFTPYSVLTSSIVERTAQMGNVDQVLSGRLTYWHGALLSVFESPLLGLGPNGFRWSEGVIPNTVQPHSALIQLIVEYGWLGGVIILYRCWLFFAPLCRNLNNDTVSQKYRLCLAMFLLSYLLYSLVDGLFYHALPMLHLAILIPLLFAYTQKQSLSRGN